eukprot:1919988-Pyramimonas_sp.AAC.1
MGQAVPPPQRGPWAGGAIAPPRAGEDELVDVRPAWRPGHDDSPERWEGHDHAHQARQVGRLVGTYARAHRRPEARRRGHEPRHDRQRGCDARHRRAGQ